MGWGSKATQEGSVLTRNVFEAVACMLFCAVVCLAIPCHTKPFYAINTCSTSVRTNLSSGRCSRPWTGREPGPQQMSLGRIFYGSSALHAWEAVGRFPMLCHTMPCNVVQGYSVLRDAMLCSSLPSPACFLAHGPDKGYTSSLMTPNLPPALATKLLITFLTTAAILPGCARIVSSLSALVKGKLRG